MTKKKKLLLLGGVAGTLVLIVLVFLALWFTMWAPPTKEDFVAAKKDADKIIEYKGLSQVDAFIKATNAEYDKGKTGEALSDSVSVERQKAIDAANNRSKLAEKLSKSKVLRDAEVKKAFDVYAPIEARYRAYIHNYVNEYPVYLNSAASCSKMFTNIRSKSVKTVKQLAQLHSTYAKECLADLGELEKSPIPPYVAYAKEFKAIANERQKVLDGAADGTITVSAATKRMGVTNQKYSTIWPKEQMKKYRSGQTFNGELKKLAELLGKKAEQAS